MGARAQIEDMAWDRKGHFLTYSWRREKAGRKVIWWWKGDLMASNQSSTL